MRRQGLVAIAPKKYRPKTTDSGHGKQASPNHIKGLEGGDALVGDITYVPTITAGWIYLATFQNRETKRIVGWKMSRSLEAGIVIEALKNAITGGHVKPGMIVHTDRGSQYVDTEYRALLKTHDLLQSMSAKGNCYENAQAESLFARYKIELLEDGIFADFDDAFQETFAYIEGYYNIHRRHSGIGYLTPINYERKQQSEEDSVQSPYQYSGGFGKLSSPVKQLN